MVDNRTFYFVLVVFIINKYQLCPIFKDYGCLGVDRDYLWIKASIAISNILLLTMCFNEKYRIVAFTN